MNNLTSLLFDTNAIRVCPDDSPFWYTSGKIGPYFINTHFLYGNEEVANELLGYIDIEKNDKLNMPKKIFDKVYKQYLENEIYHKVIDETLDFIQNNMDLEYIDYISGGERRDWFFSNIIAYLLKKPHISIFKDLSTVISDYNFEKSYTMDKLEDKKVLHIADLITEASSYIRAWIPAIQNLGSKTISSVVIVDRMQGASQRLEQLGISSHSIIQIDKDLFSRALGMNMISKGQYDMVIQFIQNPEETMRSFLLAHPEFISNSLSSDEKTAARARLCIDGNLYNL